MSSHRRNKSNKTSVNLAVAVSNKNSVVDDQTITLYNYVLDLAQEKYEYENQREQDLVQQSGQMQAAFSFMTAALFMALPVTIEHRGSLPIVFFFISTSIICFFLLVSLVLASLATWRWKKVALGNIKSIKDAVLNSNDRDMYLSESNRIYAKIEALEQVQARKEQINNYRAVFIHASIIVFFISIGSVIASFLVGLWLMMH